MLLRTRTRQTRPVVRVRRFINLPHGVHAASVFDWVCVHRLSLVILLLVRWLRAAWLPTAVCRRMSHHTSVLRVVVGAAAERLNNVHYLC